MQSERHVHDPIKLNLCRLFATTIDNILSSRHARQFNKNDAGENSALNLCTIIEAIFLHGQRQSFIDKTRSLFETESNNRLPTVDFWNFLLLLSPKHTIQQIDNLKYISRPIGKCRVWIRIALNESMLSSHLKMIRFNRETTAKYYERYAFLTDRDSLDLIEKLALKIERYDDVFCLNIDSSLLNAWPPKTIALAGIFNRAVKVPKPQTSSISEAIDVVECIDEFEKDSESSTVTVIASAAAAEAATIKDFANVTNPVSSTALDTSAISFDVREDPSAASSPHHSSTSKSSYATAVATALPSASASSACNTTTVTSDSSDTSFQSELGPELEPEPFSVRIENNVEPDDEVVVNDDRNDDDDNNNDDDDKDEGDDEEQNYSDLIDNYRTNAGDIDLKNRVREIHNKFVLEDDENNESGAEQKRRNDDGFYQALYHTPRNNGLTRQNHACDNCKRSIERKSFQCFFTNKYFCDNCMHQSKKLIPSRLLYSWDYKRYAVSKDAARYLDENRTKPLFDLSVWNPLIYRKVQIMSTVHDLRKKMILIGEYLFTCRDSKDETARFIREDHNSYIYTNLHLFSLNDFEMILNGSYLIKYTKTLNTNIEHISKCFFCTQKGYFCEICSNDRIIFPYDLKNNHLCDICRGLYHKSCYRSLKYCPKCKRLNKLK